MPGAAAGIQMQMGAQGPAGAPGAAGIIAPQTSAAAVAEMRREAEMDKLIQEQAQQAGTLRIVAERNRIIEHSKYLCPRLLFSQLSKPMWPRRCGPPQSR